MSQVKNIILPLNFFSLTWLFFVITNQTKKEFKMNENYEISRLERRYASEKTSHLLHFILTLLTGGLWIIIWVVSALATSTTKARYEKQIHAVYEPKKRKKVSSFIFQGKKTKSIAERRALYESMGYAI